MLIGEFDLVAGILHRVLVRVEPETREVCVELDGHPVFRSSANLDGSWNAFGFETPFEDLRRLVLRFRCRRNQLTGLSLWVSPTDYQLKKLGLQKFAGSSFFSTETDSWWPNPRPFAHDLGAFFGERMRFQLWHVMTLVFLFGTALTWAALHTGILNATASTSLMDAYELQQQAFRQQRFLTYGVSFLFCLGLCGAAGVGYALRAPQSSAAEQGWAFVRRAMGGLAAGYFLGAIVY